MATIASAVNTPFTPAATPFYIQVSGIGQAYLQSLADGSAPWVAITAPLGAPNVSAGIMQNPVTGTQYQFIAVSGSPVVQATQ